MNIEKIISQILSTVKDDLLQSTPDQLGLQFQVTEESSRINLQLQAGFPTLFLKQSLLPLLQSALQKAFPSYSIQINLNSFIKPHRTQLIGKSLRGVKNVIAIASGKGGVGKSTVAVNLAIALSKAGARVGILDADIYGPSIPLMLGKTNPIEVKEEYYLPTSVHGLQAMSIAYLTHTMEQALIWRGPMLAKALLEMLNLTWWDELDYLFIDLPPGTGDIQLSLVQKIPLAGAVIVTTPQQVATLDAQKAISLFEKTEIEILGVVENMSLHTCSHCGHEEAIFGQGGGEKLSSLGVKYLGQLPLASEIRAHGDEGHPTALNEKDSLALPFLRIAMKIAADLAQKPLNYASKLPPIVLHTS